jgi:hypothetical protein
LRQPSIEPDAGQALAGASLLDDAAARELVSIPVLYHV